MAKTVSAFSLILILIISNNVQGQQNYITGSVFDSKSKEPLIGVNVIVNELKGIGAVTNFQGEFAIKVPYGSYSITASLIGYRTIVKTDMIVVAGSEAHTKIYMEETTFELQQVVIKADYFDKAAKDNNISAISLGVEEILRSPGSAQDFFRILQGMAGVSFSKDQKNQLLVRGGSPDENLTIFDNMEIYSTNHFPNQTNSGGRINMINVDLIEDLQFSTGGFSAKYGDKLSSVVSITSREGTKINSFGGNINLSMQGFGTVMEGKINDGKGSWIFSARSSYLDLIKGPLGLNSTVPKYWDNQFKLAYDLSNIHKLSLTGIYGNDKVYDDGSTDDEKPEMANMTDSTGRKKSDIRQTQLASGINLRSIWNKNLYSLLTLYYSNYHSNYIMTEDFVQRTFDSAGKEKYTNVLNRRPYYVDKHDNGQAVIKAELVWNINKVQELNFGCSIGTIDFNQFLYLAGDSVRYFRNNAWTIVREQPASLSYKIKLFNNHKSYAYLNDKFRMLNNRLFFILGLRYDYFSYSGAENISPRFSATYYLVPEITNINLSYGEYYQTQSFSLYEDREHSDVNKNLKNTHATHYILGIEHIIDAGLKLSLEGYYKNYTNIPVEETFIYSFDRTNRSLRNLSIGKQHTYGIDLMVQQKLVKDIYGTLGISKMWSKFTDPRIGKEGKEYPSDYEFPNIITIITGKRFAGVRDQLDKMPFLIKYLSYALPFSNDMEISFRWRYASGKPYTPYSFVTTEQAYEGEMKWAKGSWVPSDEINSERYPDYHRLDISFSSRYNFNKCNLSVFLTIENLYNRKNVGSYEYNSDGTRDIEKQFSLFPVAGIELQL